MGFKGYGKRRIFAIHVVYPNRSCRGRYKNRLLTAKAYNIITHAEVLYGSHGEEGCGCICFQLRGRIGIPFVVDPAVFFPLDLGEFHLGSDTVLSNQHDIHHSKKLGYVENKSTVDRDRIRAMFRLVALLTFITAVSFYFVFDQVIESAKPDVPREKFDAEVLAGLFIFILVITLYLSAPLLIAVIIAHSYGYGWKDLRRDTEARRKMSYVYILYFLLLFLFSHVLGSG